MEHRTERNERQRCNGCAKLEGKEVLNIMEYALSYIQPISLRSRTFAEKKRERTLLDSS